MAGIVSNKLADDLNLGALLPSVLERLTAPVSRMQTGFSLLDSFISDDDDGAGGFVFPSLVVLGAQPKAGKSTWAQMVAEQHVSLSENHYVLYFDLENGRERSMRRIIQRHAKLTNRDFKVGLSKDQHYRFKTALGWMTDGPGQRFLLQTQKPPSPREFAGLVATLKQELGRDKKLLVVIDSLQKLTMNLEDRRAGVDMWLRELEDLRGQLRICVLAVSELSRTAGKKNYDTGAAKYKESGDIEYTCDLGLSMSIKKGHIIMQVEFNRDGPIGPVCELLPAFAVNNMTEQPLTVREHKDDE